MAVVNRTLRTAAESIPGPVGAEAPEPGSAADRPRGPQGTVFSPRLHLLAVRCEDDPRSSLDLTDVLEASQRWREAIISNSNGLPDRVRSLLSGHLEDGSPVDAPHLAFLPLAPVGHPRADGRLHGMGLVFPGDTPDEDRGLALRAIGAVSHLMLGPLGAWRVVPETGWTPSRVMRAESWTADPDGATQWATVTPVVFDRHPKAKTRTGRHRESSAMIARACARIGLPEPREVILTDVSATLGCRRRSRLRRCGGRMGVSGGTGM